MATVTERGADPTEQIGEPPESVREELRAFRAELDRVVPGKSLDRNLLVGTWNIRAFGDATKNWRSGEGDEPRRDLRDLCFIAEIVSRFDVVAIQEVRDNLRALRYMLRRLGLDWGVILTDVTKGSDGNNERLAFVFDTRRVKPSGLACELVVPAEHRVDVRGQGRRAVPQELLRHLQRHARAREVRREQAAVRARLLRVEELARGGDAPRRSRGGGDRRR